MDKIVDRRLKAAMVTRNRAKYDIGLAKVASGEWTVDVATGQFFGLAGQPIGYLAKSGYRRLTTMAAGVRYYIQAHCLLWEIQHGPIPEGMEVNHINGVKSDNRAENFELVTQSGNARHALALGLKTPDAGERHSAAKLTDAAITQIRRRSAAGETRASLAREFGVGDSHISRIARGVQRTRTTRIAA